jgi:hypothetical protein
MVTISITTETFAAIEATLPKGTKGLPRPDGKGCLLGVPPRDVLDPQGDARRWRELQRRDCADRKGRLNLLFRAVKWWFLKQGDAHLQPRKWKVRAARANQRL